MNAQQIGERLVTDRVTHEQDHALARPHVPTLEELAFDELDQILAMLDFAREMDRTYAPDELQAPRDLFVGGEDDDRHDGPVARHQSGGEAALGEGDDAAGVELA